MAVSQVFPGPIANRLLAALPQEDYQRLLPHLEAIPLVSGETLYEPGEPFHHVYFPTGGIISTIIEMEDAAAVETGLIGNEGMTGLHVFLGSAVVPLKTVVQVPGSAMRMKADVFHAEISRSTSLHGLLHRYTDAFLIQTAQSVACNCLHPLAQRCCFWLLKAHDRVGVEQFPLTQEFLAAMLGVRRPSVQPVAHSLREAGLIRYTRGNITIVNRKGLEAASCSCYRIVKSKFDRLASGDLLQ